MRSWTFFSIGSKTILDSVIYPKNQQQQQKKGKNSACQWDTVISMWEHVQNQDVFHWLSRNKLVFYRPTFNRYFFSGRMVIANSSSRCSSKEVRALYFLVFSSSCLKPQNTAERRQRFLRRTHPLLLSAPDAINIVTICLTNSSERLGHSRSGYIEFVLISNGHHHFYWQSSELYISLSFGYLHDL